MHVTALRRKNFGDADRDLESIGKSGNRSRKTMLSSINGVEDSIGAMLRVNSGGRVDVLHVVSGVVTVEKSFAQRSRIGA